jgi:chromosome segregation ATPase
MFREITRLRDVQDMKTKESLDQHDRMKALEYDHQKTVIHIDETNKCVEARAFDIRNKTVSLQDNENEIGRLREINSNQNVEITALRRDVDRVSADCYDYRKNIEQTECRNVDMSGKIRSYEIQNKEKEENLFGCKKDVENQQYTNSNMRNDLNDYLAEKEALERHSRILLGQNDDLTKELERFVNTDE